jgi:hypothetical protein
MGQARRHHYVPQFYLKNFASQLFTVDLLNQNSFPASTKNVAVEQDFHTVSISGQASDTIEKSLSVFEGNVSLALDRIISTASLNNAEDRNTLLYFATLLFVKNPAARKIINDFSNELMRKTSKMEANDFYGFQEKINSMIERGTMDQDVDIEKLRQIIINGDYTISLSTDAHLQTEFKNALPLFTQCVATRRWNMYLAKAGQFVTCDRPVVLMWNDPKNNNQPGLGLRNTRVLFSLSSEIAIIGGFELQDRKIIEVGNEDVAKINGRIILNANRQVYARDEKFGYMLQHNAGIRSGIDLQNDDFTKAKAYEKNADHGTAI